MPARRETPRTGAARQPQTRRSVDHILSQRELLVAEVADLRRGGASKLVENAQQLLTRWWASANWSAREELLRSATWLIQVEKTQRADSISSVTVR